MSGDIEDKPQPLLEHLIELRQRLMWAVGAFFIAFLVCFYFAKQLFNILVLPFKWSVEWAGLTHRNVELIYTAPQEFLFTQMKLALFGAFCISFPIIAAQLYKFVAPGLYKNERKAFVPYLVMDKGLDPVAAIEKSWFMTRGHGWRIFGMWMLTIVLVIGGLLVVGVGAIFALMWSGAAFASLYHAVDLEDQARLNQNGVAQSGVVPA